MKKFVPVVVGVIVVGALVTFAFIQGKKSAEAPAPSSSDQGQQAATPSSSSPSSSGSGRAAVPTSTPKPSPTTPTGNTSGTLKVTSPASGEIWSFGTTHAIAWSGTAKYTGSIVLLEAASRKTVGWITPSISGSQVEFSWDTRAVLVSKTQASKKDIELGTYVIQIVCEGSRAAIESAPFTVANGGERIVVRRVSVKNGNFVPNTLAINRAEQVVVRNEDVATMTLQLNGATLATLPQWSSYVFNGSAYAPGRYELRIKEQILARATITVQ